MTFTCDACPRRGLAVSLCCGSLSSARRFYSAWLTWTDWRWRLIRGRGFFVRGWRGWADHDVSGLDSHIASILKGALVKLAERGHGVPSAFVEFDARGDAVDIDRDAARWESWLKDKAEWFAWYARDNDCLQLHVDDSTASEEEKNECARAHLEKMGRFQNEVLPDFVKHFQSLWI